MGVTVGHAGEAEITKASSLTSPSFLARVVKTRDDERGVGRPDVGSEKDAA